MRCARAFWGLASVILCAGWLAGAIPSTERAALIAFYNATGGDDWTIRTGWKTPPLSSDGFAMPGTERFWYGINLNEAKTAVTEIRLFANNLVGQLPTEMTVLTSLETLILYRNQLSGSLPTWLGNFPNLKNLSLNNNDFSGTIPAQLGSLPNLQILSLGSNQLTGEIPSQLGNLTHLQVLSLLGNQLYGGIPDQLASLSSLQELSLGWNHLSGTIPDWLGNLTQLNTLGLTGNQLTGEIPATLQNLTGLLSLALGDNRLTGAIPSWLGQLTNLLNLWLHGNQLTGNVPAQLGGLTSLRALFLHGNQLTGSFPEALQSLTNLDTLWLSGNQFSGSLPAWIGNLTKLQALLVDCNLLGGPLPGELGNLSFLLLLDCGNNRFSGAIPSQLGNLTNLLGLSLEGNALAGEVPYSFYNLTKLVPGAQCSIDYNALKASDPTLKSFLDQKFGSGWSANQTVPPGSFQASVTGAGAVKMGWTPVPSPVRRRTAADPVGDEGADGYELWGENPADASWLLLALLADRDDAEATEALRRAQVNRFKIRSFTGAHPQNQNTVYSEFSPVLEVSPPTTEANVDIYADGLQAGTVLPESPSQILPSSALTLRIPPEAFPAATPSNPVCLRVKLPGKALLSQTLATGSHLSPAPTPLAGERVLDLAVAEYHLVGGKPAQIAGAALAGIGLHSVQLLRYVEGEDAFWLRVNESTAGWAPQNGGEFLGVTVGTGGGYWPMTAASNWGSDGIGAQAPTLLCGDMREYVLDQEGAATFTVSLLTQEQLSEALYPLTFGDNPFQPLFSGGVADEGKSATAAVGGTIADVAEADVNLDGLADLVTVLCGVGSVFWSPGREGGGFGGTREVALDPASGEPAVVEVADVDGDALPDLLVGEKAGQLSVYPWAEVFGATRKTAARPSCRRFLSGEPADSLALDVNADGKKDFVAIVPSASQMEVALGDTFSGKTAYNTPGTPVSLATGDFNGDGAPDLAVACASSNGATVFWNDGNGTFTRQDLGGLGLEPSAVAAGDLNRDGRADLLVALRASLEVAAILATAGNNFDLAGRQRLVFRYKPNSVLLSDLDGKFGPDATVGFEDDYRLSQMVTDASGHLGAENVRSDTVGAFLTDVSGAPRHTGVSGLTAGPNGRSAGGIYSSDGLLQTLETTTAALYFPRSDGVSFALVNLGAEPADAYFQLYADGQAGTRSAGTQALAAGRQLIGFLFWDNILGPEAQQPDHWATTGLNGAGLDGFYMQPAPGGSELDGGRLPASGQELTEMAFPEIRTGTGYTVLTLINPGWEQASASFFLYGGNGSLKGQARRLITPGTRLEAGVAELFPAAAEGDWILVRSDRGLLGSEAFGTSNANAAVLAALTSGLASRVLYDPHMASGDFGIVYYFSDITLVNTGEGAALVQVTRRDNDGNVLNTASVNVPAKGKVRTEVSALFGLTGTVEGWMQADPGSAAGVTGCMTFGEAGTTSRILACLPLQDLGHRRFLLPYIANGTFGASTYFTGVAVLEPDPEARTRVRLTAHDGNGAELAARTYTLRPPDPDKCAECHKRQVFLLGLEMSELPTMAGGYLVLEAETITHGLLVFQLFGDIGNTVLSAVPSIPLD